MNYCDEKYEGISRIYSDIDDEVSSVERAVYRLAEGDSMLNVKQLTDWCATTKQTVQDFKSLLAYQSESCDELLQALEDCESRLDSIGAGAC